MILIKKMAVLMLSTGLALGAGVANAADKAAADAACSAAKAANSAAGKAGAEWRDTGKTIKKAEEALGKGDFDSAISLCKEMERQAMVGKKAIEAQKGIGTPNYMK